MTKGHFIFPLGSGYKFSRAYKTAFQHVHKVVNYIASTSAEHIHLPDAAELLNLTLGELDHQRVILIVDGFVMKIQRTAGANEAYFCGRSGKHYDALNVQYVIDKNGKIRHILAGISGRSHDKNAIEWSAPFLNFLNNLPDGYVVLADNAYTGLHPNCLAMFKHGGNPQQRQFNADAAKLRIKVENVIGANENIWRVLMSKENRVPAKYTVEFASKLAISAAVLHNRFTNYF